MVAATIHLVAEIRSFKRTELTLKHVIGHSLSAKTIERLTRQIGLELTEVISGGGEKEVIVAEVAVVSCDGGRIRTRAADSGPGVHEAAWRETKNSSFERMSAPVASSEDPCSTLPDTFRRVAHVAQIAEKAAFSGVSADSALPSPAVYEGPERILRTCVSSMECSKKFGVQMHREARRRRFHEAKRRVFISDGLAWNWSIWRTHFPTFTPILDFIHAVHYAYAAAEAWETDGPARWKRYLELAEALWQGRSADILASLQAELARRGISDDEEVPEDSPSRPLVDALRYFTNNRQRMNYPTYRRQGLPITSSPMESLIKQINHRVKGTEMFWLQPEGAEAILQIRAASLSEDGRLQDYLQRRPGHPFVRRPSHAIAA